MLFMIQAVFLESLAEGWNGIMVPRVMIVAMVNEILHATMLV